MNRSSSVHVTLSKIACSRRAKLAAATSAFVLTSFAAVSSVGEAAHGDRAIRSYPKSAAAASYAPVKVAVARTDRADSANPKVAPVESAAMPSLDLNGFNERFGGSPGRSAEVGGTSGSGALHGEAANIVVAYSPDHAASDVDRREQAVRSSIEVFSYGVMQGEDPLQSIDGPATGAVVAASGGAKQPRADLLVGVPPEFAELVKRIATEEGVDPNLMLSIMRVENAAFDPEIVSPAGAIGLMQVMPKVGEAFGAADLTDPEQNVRAGARFLRVLVEKYRNPVLIASAYNAGEPKVDVRRSLPLIEETADYVTRVVGLYTNTSTTDEVFQIGRSAGVPPAAKRSGARSGRAERAKAPMLVFSVGNTADATGRVEQESGQVHVGGPVKIKKEEVLQ
ncbi:lytic transglycosylase domain-containing protein [Ensifer sp. P24N7]|uniref:lytic transglycosylase domain-containing protein n=1 Tax=Sinorhizobium sp. P24N7 TaxID=3348358 RepID=UPI0035F2CF1E